MELKQNLRFWELDFIKGIAIIGVIIYHFIFDLSFFTNLNINEDFWVWLLIARISATIFILISGISLFINYQKQKLKNFVPFQKILTRSIKLIFLANLITLSTYIFLPEGTIIFGILHFLAIAPLIGYIFLLYPNFSILFSFIIFLFTPLIKITKVKFYWLLCLGLEPIHFSTLDYFPLFPWLGVFLLGIFLGNIAYKNNQRKISIKNYSDYPIIYFFSLLGKNTLSIYLIHQPILIALIFISSQILNKII